MAVIQEDAVPTMPVTDGNSGAAPTSYLVPGFVVWVYSSSGAANFQAKVQVSYNGTDWLDVAVAAAAPLRVKVSEPAKFVRVVTSAHAGGTPAATVLGHSSESGN